MSGARYGVKGLLRDEGGTAAIEFAIVSIAFLSFVFAIAYMGIILFTNATLQWAVEDGARLAEINPAATQSDISDAVNNYLGSIDAETASVSYSVSQSGSTKTGTILASVSESYIVPLINDFTINYEASTTVPLSS